MIPPSIQVIFFDAVGTLIEPSPSVAEAYAAIGARFGSQLSTAVVRTRFRQAFAAEEAHDRDRQLRTDEGRERARWQRIVASVLDDVHDPAGCFAALYEHFAQPTAWRCLPDAAAVLAELRRRGYRLGIASNFDHRLQTVVAGLPELWGLDALVISSLVGWRKPAPEFFAAVRSAARVAVESILVVGDDRANDYEGARAAGMHALHFDPQQPMDGTTGRIGALSELLLSHRPR